MKEAVERSVEIVATRPMAIMLVASFKYLELGRGNINLI